MSEYFESVLISRSTPEHVAVKLGGECSCKHCTNGCKFGSGIFKKDEEKKLAKHLSISEEELYNDYLEETELFNTKLFKPKVIKKDKPYGKCIFFDEGTELCKVYPVRPLLCKVATGHEHGEHMYAWFLLNHLVNTEDPESIRQYSTYLKFNKTIYGGRLHELIKDKDKLKKILSYEILRKETKSKEQAKLVPRRHK
ncbi:MAG: YkgJ family cysteine cluster protein [Nanoarchaeota archaeon]|nr:YkgJ family cysteine cluster protein [Nanoarchaeota archaeon]